jgi:hypothetical protein
MHVREAHLVAHSIAEDWVIVASLDKLRLLGQKLRGIGGDAVFVGTIQNGVS